MVRVVDKGALTAETGRVFGWTAGNTTHFARRG